MVSPITPSDIAAIKAETIPGFVIEAFNREITKKYSNGAARVFESAVVDAIMATAPLAHDGKPMYRQRVYEEGWLDVEPLFRKIGWVVEYDRPGYNESYSAYFIFKWL